MSHSELMQQYWSYCGTDTFAEDEVDSALSNLKSALVCGQKIPRTNDKTLAPLYGPRLDIQAKFKNQTNK